MKKIISFALSLLMALSILPAACFTAGAANTGSLTINVPLQMGSGLNAPKTAIVKVTGPNGYEKDVAYSSIYPYENTTLSGLAAGSYTVSLTNADRAGYTLSTNYYVDMAQTSTGTVSAGSTTTFTIQPMYTKAQDSASSLTINIPLLMDDGINAPTSAVIWVTGPNNYAKDIAYSSIYPQQSITLTGLAAGPYAVSLTNADRPGYTLNTTYTVDGVSKSVASVAAGKTAQMTIQPMYTKIPDTSGSTDENTAGSLTINIPLLMDDGINAPTSAVIWVTGPNNYAKDIAYSSIYPQQSITLTGLAAGPYAVSLTNADREGYTLNTTYTVDGVSQSVASVAAGKTAQMTIQPMYTKISSGSSSSGSTTSGFAPQIFFGSKNAGANIQRSLRGFFTAFLKAMAR